jgi:uncharacterized protein YndB with AHSA1/START domain
MKGDDLDGTRSRDSVERVIRIEAPAGDVWRALTDPDELANWFPLEAEVIPGAGGRIHARWDDETWFDEKIECWTPDEHLRTIGVDGGWAGIATDYHLSGERGSTTLRVVSSGFGASDDWQEMLDAFGGGWDFELRGLRHYLERHRGSSRRVVRATVTHDGDVKRCWNRLTGAGGFLHLETAAAPARPDGTDTDASDGTTAPPAPFAAATAAGQVLTGLLYDMHPPKQIVAAVNEYNDALFRLQVLPASIGSTATLWLSAYDVDPEELAGLQASWQTWLEEHAAAE